MDIKQLLQDLSVQFETTLELDDNQGCSLIIDDILVNLQYQSFDSTLLVHTLVSYRENGFNNAQLERALEFNLFGYECLNFHLGYFKAMRALILSGTVAEQDFDAKSLKGYLMLLVETTRKIESEIDALDDNEAIGSDSATDTMQFTQQSFMLNV